jgi:Ala-tRNA(Pro) deacylase
MNHLSRAQEVIEVLGGLGINFSVKTHPPVYTVEEAEHYWEGISGAHCKNLFIRNKKGTHHYLIIIRSSKSVDLKALTALLQEDRLSFASAERLMKYLGLEQGSVSPFGLIHDRDKDVEVIIDDDLAEEGRVNFHPNDNTATLGLSYGDFEKFLAWCGNKVRRITL